MAQAETMKIQTGIADKGTGGPKKVHAIANVQTVLVDCTDGNGVRSTLLAFVAADNVVIVPNNGMPAQQWLKEEILKKIAGQEG